MIPNLENTDVQRKNVWLILRTDHCGPFGGEKMVDLVYWRRETGGEGSDSIEVHQVELAHEKQMNAAYAEMFASSSQSKVGAE